jgi:hypothetical protein
MPQYLISVLDDTTNTATAEEMAAIDVFNEGRRCLQLLPAHERYPRCTLNGAIPLDFPIAFRRGSCVEPRGTTA